MAETSQVSPEISSQASPKETRPIYEIGFHVVPSLDEAGVIDVAQKIHTAIEKGDAEIISKGVPSKIRLAYTIERKGAGHYDKFDEAYFGFIKFATERENIAALEQMLRADRSILRYLLTETTREDVMGAPRRAVFASDRLEGETIKKPTQEPEKAGEVSEEDLNKSIDAIVS
jgi:ribosomal protein S6